VTIGLLYAAAETPWGRRWLRETLCQVLHDQLGLDAELGYVRLEPTLLPPGIEIVARGIELSHPTEGRLVSATRLSVQPAISSLLMGRLDLRRIQLDSPHVRLVVRDGALVNGPTLPASEDDSPAELPFRYVTITNGAVRVIGDLPVTGAIEGLYAELATSGTRAMSVDLRIARGIVYHPRGEEPLQSLVAEGVLDLDRGVSVSRLRLVTPSARLAVRHGHVPLPWNEQASGTIDAHVDVDRIGPMIEADLGIPLSGALDVHGEAHLDHAHYGGNAHVVLDGFGVDGRKIGEPLEFDVVADETEARITNGVMHMPFGGGSVGLEATLGLASPFPLEATLDFRRLELATLLSEIGVTPNAIVRWSFVGPARLHGTLVPFRLVGPLDVESSDFFVSAGPWHREPRERIMGVPRGHLRARVDLDADGLSFEEIDLVTDHSQLRANAFISFHDTFEVTAQSDHLDLLDVSPLTTFPLSGVGSIDVRVGGLYSDPELAATGFLRGFSFDGMPLGDLDLTADFEEGGLVAHFPEIRAIHGDSRYTVRDLRLDFTEHLEVDADIELESVALDDLYQTFHLDQDERFDPYSGVGRGHARAHYTVGFPDDGPTGTLVTDLDIDLGRTNLAGYAFESGRFEGQVRWYDFDAGFDGAELDVGEFILHKGPGTIAVVGTIAQQGALDLRLIADRILFEDIEGIGDEWPLATGEAGVLGTISNTLAIPRMDLDLTLANVRWANRDLGNARFYVKLTDPADPWIVASQGLDPDHLRAGESCVRGRQALLHADWPPDPPLRTAEGLVPALDTPEAFLVCGSGFDGSLVVDAALGFTDVGPHRGRIAFRDLDLGPFLPAGSDGDAASGRITGYVDLVAGDLDTDRTSTGTVHLDALELAASGVRITNQGPWDIELKRGTAHFASATLVGNGTELALSGTASSTELALSLEGEVGMDLFAAASPALASATGTTALRILVRGPIDDPEVVGEATFTNVSVEHASLPVPVSDLSGRVEFSQRRIAIEGVHGRIGSGTVSVEGSASIDGGSLSSYRVAAELDDIAIRPEDGLELAFGGSLEAVWDESRTLPLLRGTVDLERVRYTRPVQVTPTLGQMYRPTRTEVETYDPALDVVDLDIRVIQHAPFEIRNNLVDVDVTIEDDERPFRVVGTNQRMGALGTLDIPRGRMFFRGTSFEIRRGTIELDDRQRIHPRFDVLATSDIRRNYDSTAPAFRIQLAATGDSDAFTLSATSTPGLSQQDIMLLLIVGMTSSELQNLQASQLSTTALDALSTLTGVEGRLSEALRVVDEVSLTTMYHPITNRPEPQLTVGSRITDRIRVTASTGLTSETRSIRTTAEWRLDDRTSVQAVYDNLNRETASAFGNLGVDVRYRLEFE